MEVGPTWAIVPARMGSSRLPGKALAPIAGVPALRRIIERLQLVDSLDGICIASPALPENEGIAICAIEAGVSYYYGGEADLVGRILDAARAYGVETIVHITGDCPLVDPAIVTHAIRTYRHAKPDYLSNRLHGYAYPIGMDVEVFPTWRLAQINREDLTARDREHVTNYFYEHPELFTLHDLTPPQRHYRPDLRLTLDTEEDLALLSAIYETCPWDCDLDQVLAFLDEHPSLLELNSHVEQVVP